MTRTQYTMLFAVMGAALAWWSRRDPARPQATLDRGEVIFRNTPLPSEPGAHIGA